MNKDEIKTIEQKAYAVTMGCIRAVGLIILLGWGVIAALNFLGIGIDDTDYSGWNRSGMVLHTDAKTGLQYLSTKSGNLIPRLDLNGKQMFVGYSNEAR
jgi:hypothetical protein